VGLLLERNERVPLPVGPQAYSLPQNVQVSEMSDPHAVHGFQYQLAISKNAKPLAESTFNLRLVFLGQAT
jgi:hypothetical protein